MSNSRVIQELFKVPFSQPNITYFALLDSNLSLYWQKQYVLIGKNDRYCSTCTNSSSLISPSLLISNIWNIAPALSSAVSYNSKLELLYKLTNVRRAAETCIHTIRNKTTRLSGKLMSLPHNFICLAHHKFEFSSEKIHQNIIKSDRFETFFNNFLLPSMYIQYVDLV